MTVINSVEQLRLDTHFSKPLKTHCEAENWLVAEPQMSDQVDTQNLCTLLCTVFFPFSPKPRKHKNKAINQCVFISY